MGWVKDNFPGSPAQFQRTKVARGMVAYVFVAGGLIYAFSPWAKNHRQAVKDGLWDNPDWIKEKEFLRNTNSIAGIPKRKEVDVWLEESQRTHNQEGDEPFLKPKTA